MNRDVIFRVGDLVEATAPIVRKDGRSKLDVGELATVSKVYRVDMVSPQIIGLEIAGRLPMGDIVCLENVPLKNLGRSKGW